MTQVRCVLVGDKGIGKKHLLHMYHTKTWPTSVYKPVLFGINDMTVDVQVEEESISLRVERVTPDSEYERLRSVIYMNSNVFLVCFSLIDPTTLKNCEEQWFPELKGHFPATPIVLLGTKKDLRDEATENFVPFSRGLEVSEEIKALRYMECSSFTQEGLEEVLVEVARVGLNAIRKKNRKGPCSIL